MNFNDLLVQKGQSYPHFSKPVVDDESILYLNHIMSKAVINDPIKVIKVSTKPHQDQKPGTSGLRKKVKVFTQQHFTENFIQCYFLALRRDALSPKCTLLVGGDGRYFSREAISLVCRIACANGVDELHIAKDGLMSTPACSAYIRNLNKEFGNCLGGILLTASHNPGGPEQDFGIKFNSRNGGPALEQFTNTVYAETKIIQEFYLSDMKFLKGESENSPVDLSQMGQYRFQNVDRPYKSTFVIKVVENVEQYIDLMKEQFDFEAIKRLFGREDFKFVFDGMFGAAGPYAKTLFEREFKGQSIKLLNCEPKQDFNKEHPDPNLKCAHQLVEIMGVGQKKESEYNMGAACDGDADRNMIIGKCFFVTPSDSLAVLTANYKLFLKAKLFGVARSMPTSGAVDRVAKRLGINLYETPTGWKFFGNLMENNCITLCGEESFGTGSTHIREKDGLWTVLAWLNLLANANKDTEIGKFKEISDIVTDFWKDYGRNYYCRYDFQNCELEAGKKTWENLMREVKNYQQGDIKADIFEYTDVIDHSISKDQGIRFIYKDGSRVVFRQSGTGSVGMTIRMYLEKYEEKDVMKNQFEALKEMIEFGLKTSKIAQFTGKKEPDVIT